MMNDLADKFEGVRIESQIESVEDVRQGQSSHKNSKSRRSNHSRIQGTGWASNHIKRTAPRNMEGFQSNFSPKFQQQSISSSDSTKKPVDIIDPFYPIKSFHEEELAPVRGKNTESFTPSHEPAQIRIVCAPFGLDTYNRLHTPRDVVVVQSLFDCNSYEIYENLKNEIASSVPEDVWVPWHGDSHLIANDKLSWKKYCPTFNRVLDELCTYFKMEAKATRLNWYRDNSAWKPYHHDASAVKVDKANSQNITVAASFGAEREVAFEHAKTKTTLSLPLINGSVYSFGKEVNILWRHGIPQMSTKINTTDRAEKGRFSVIVWGWTHLGQTD